MENSLFSLLYYLDISNQLLKKNQIRYHRVYLKLHLTNSITYQDHHATSQFHHKVGLKTLSGHIKY